MKNKFIKILEKTEKFFIAKIINRKIKLKYILITILLIFAIAFLLNKFIKSESSFLKHFSFIKKIKSSKKDINED